MMQRLSIQKRAIAAAVVTTVCAMASIETPPIGKAFANSTIADADEKAIVEQARAEARRCLGREVVLKLTSLKREGPWAFLVSRMLDQTGEPIDFTGTVLEEAFRAGVASHTFCALLRREAGRWTIVATCLGVTDVGWTRWDRRYGAPAAIFKLDDVE